MNATNTQILEFENNQASDATVSFDRMQTQRPAHSFFPLTATDRPVSGCRAWPTGQGLIYVVDTFPHLATLAQTILESEGFATCAFDDRSMAWHAFAFASPKPTLLITDNLDGNAAAKDLINRCRSIAPRLKTLLVDHRLSFSRCTPDWADGLLLRPYCSLFLIQEAKRLCADRQLTSARSVEHSSI